MPYVHDDDGNPGVDGVHHVVVVDAEPLQEIARAGRFGAGRKSARSCRRHSTGSAAATQWYEAGHDEPQEPVKASCTDPGFSGLKTASGEPFNPNAMTAASKTLPLGSVVHVTNPKTGRSVTVRINDRGAYVKGGRSLDLSKGAARRIGLTGVERVKIHKVKTPSETEAVETPAAKPHEDAVVTSDATSAATTPATASPAAASPGASPDAATNASDATAHSNYDVASDLHP